MNTHKNSYNIIFTLVLVIFISALLSALAISLKPIQQKNATQEKMQYILKSLGYDYTREESAVHFDDIITEQVVIDAKGEVVSGVKAFDINMNTEVKKPKEEQLFPIYGAVLDEKTYYVVPLVGTGLWNTIWGYFSLNEDFNTVNEVVFDHLGETPGLGAEITKDWFRNQFKGKKLFDENGTFKSIEVIKGSVSADNLFGVNAIAGSTLTCNGVTNMIKERFEHYITYFKNKQKVL